MAANVIELSSDMNFIVVDDAPASREGIVKSLKTLGFKNVFEGVAKARPLNFSKKKILILLFVKKT